MSRGDTFPTPYGPSALVEKLAAGLWRVTVAQRGKSSDKTLLRLSASMAARAPEWFRDQSATNLFRHRGHYWSAVLDEHKHEVAVVFPEAFSPQAVCHAVMGILNSVSLRTHNEAKAWLKGPGGRMARQVARVYLQEYGATYSVGATGITSLERQSQIATRTDRLHTIHIERDGDPLPFAPAVTLEELKAAGWRVLKIVPKATPVELPSP